MLFAVKCAPEFFKFAVVLGQLKRTLYVKPAANLQKCGFDIPVDDIHGFALLDAVMIDDSAPETIIVHGFLLYAARGLRYNTDMDCNG